MWYWYWLLYDMSACFSIPRGLHRLHRQSYGFSAIALWSRPSKWPKDKLLGSAAAISCINSGDSLCSAVFDAQARESCSGQHLVLSHIKYAKETWRSCRANWGWSLESLGEPEAKRLRRCVLHETLCRAERERIYGTMKYGICMRN